MIKTLSQLKRTLKENMCLEITGHCREECVGEIRRVTKVNTQGFYSTVAAPANRVDPSRNPVLWWSKAPFWSFENGICSIYNSDQHHTVQYLIMSFRVLEEKEAA